MVNCRPFTKLACSGKPFYAQVRCLATHTLSSSTTYNHDAKVVPSEFSSSSTAPAHPMTSKSQPPPLSILSTSSLCRSLAINSLSCSPTLLPPSMKIMSILAHSRSRILSPDKNPILRYFLKNTFYKQFCAGEDLVEVQQTIKQLKAMGFKGVMLAYAKEVVLDEGGIDALESCGGGSVAEECIAKEIIPWQTGTLETVRMAEPGDFVSLKFTGAGTQALFDLSQSQNTTPSKALDQAITAICDLAYARGVRLQFDAEQQSLQKGIDRWTVDYMRKYNSLQPGHAVIYNTYQCYLKATPRILAEHLALAQAEGWTMGVKLVRGAYIGSDPRHLIHDTKADTDAHYDGIAESLMKRQYGTILKPATQPGQDTDCSNKSAAVVSTAPPFPSLMMTLAGHNHTSVRRALACRTQQIQQGEPRVDMVYAQLQGMADDVSCELLQASELARGREDEVDAPQVYKYLVWGTTGECMKYLLRRAQENKDAVARTRQGRDAMAREVVRRVKAFFGMTRA